MPDSTGVNFTRTQISARHAYRRALEKAVRVVSKGTGWRTIEGCLFREQGGWFISACPAVLINAEATKAIVSAKPMTIDPVFWGIVDMPENAAMPLSFRLNGAWTCQPPRFDEVPIPEDQDASVVAARLLATANDRLAVVERWSVETFLQLCRSSATTEDSYLTCVVASLVTLGRESEALDACKAAKGRGANGGFLSREGSFTDMATRWLTAELAQTTLH
jgi:hypothetical protein